MRKKFLLMLTVLVIALGGSGKLFAQQLLVNCDYNSSTEGYGVTKFSNYAGAYAYATANAQKATIVIEKTNTLSGNTFDNNHKNYSKLAVVIKDGATMGNALSKWDMTYPVTVEPGGTLTCARPANASVSNVHIKNTLTVGAVGSTKKAYVNFLSDSYQDCDISIRYNGKILVYNADFAVQDLDAQGTLTIENSEVYVDGAFASATFYATTLTNSTITIKGNQISGGLSDFAGGTYNQLGNVKLNNSKLTIEEGDTKVAANVTATNSTIAVNNLTVNSGKTLNLNEGSTLDVDGTITNNGNIKINGTAATIEGNEVFVPVAQTETAKYKSLQAAVNAVQNGETITLTADITENVTLTEKTGLTYTINGNGKTMNGAISVNSLSDTEDNRRITVKNIKFVDTADANVDFISSVNTNHYPRLTIEGCTFTGSGNDGDVAVRLKSSHSVVIKDCTGTGLHSFLQNTSGWNLTIENVKVTNSKSGLALGTVQGVTVKGSNIDVAGYGIRLDAQYNNNAVIESNTVKAFIPVVVRKASVDSNITFNGTNEFTATNTDGLWCAIGTSEYETNGTMPTAATGKVRVTLNDTELSYEGVYGNYYELAGEGTAENPYLINSVYDLKYFRDKVDEQAQDGSTQFAGKYFKLTADLDLAGINWNPIGSMSGDHGSFKGVFDGGNHTISNLNCEQAGNGLGLFARTAGNAEIKNLKLNNVTVKSTDNSNYVGGVVGNAYASTKINNVHVSGTINIAGRGYIGGIAGHGYVVMDNVSVVANEGSRSLITSTFWCAGGILGYAGEGSTNIMNANVEGITITSAAGGLGAIVGMAEDNNGTQPISGSNLSAKNVEIKTYVGAYGTYYEDYAIGYLYGGNPTSKLTGKLNVENVTLTNASGKTPAEVSDAVANVDGKIYFAFSNNEFKLLENGNNVTILRAGKYSIPTGKDLTITGAVNGVVFENIDAYGMGGANVTFNNVTFNYAENSTYKGLQHSGNLVYNNCTINGQVFLYGESETFNGCTFNTKDSNNYNVWTYGAKNVAFNECTFNSAGKSVLIYAESAEIFNNVTVAKCTFNASQAVEGKAAIEMDSSLTSGINLTISNTTATGFGNGNVSGNSLWNNKKGNADAANNDITVKVGDDVVLAPIYEAQIGEVKYRKLADAFAAAQAGDVVKVFAGTYAMPSMKAGITIIGEGNVIFEGTLTGTLENLTMKNIHIKGGNAQRWAYAKGNLLFENVTFEATSVYALHFDGITAGTNLTYKNCTIIGWAALGGSPASCTFEGCTIKGNGTYGVIRTYFDATIKDCTFDVDNVNTTDAYQDGIHAVEGAQVVVENCTNANGDMKDLVNVHANSVVTVDGVEIKNAAKVGNNYYLTLQDAFAAVGGGAVVIELLDNATLNYGAREAYGTAETTSLTINGNGKVLTLNQTNSDWSSFGLANADAKVVFNNMTIEKTGKGDTSGAWNTHAIIFSSNVEMNNLIVNNAIAVQAGAILNNVAINEANGYYGLWINGNGQTVTMNSGSITATNGGRGIKIADQYIDNPAQVTLNVTGTVFKTAKKAAVLVSSKAGAKIAASNVNIENVAADKVNFVWVDEDWAANYGNVEVTGATVAQEGKGSFVAAVEKDAKVQAYYKDLHAAMVAAKAGETVVLIADVDLAGTEWEPVSFGGTFDGKGKIIFNLTINKPGVSNTGFIKSLNGTVKNVTFTNPTVTGGENTAVVAGRAGGSAALAENITINGTIKVETKHSGYARAAAIVGGWAYGNYKNITVDGGDKANSYIKHTGGGDGRYVAGIVGHADDVNSYVNCTVKNITISGGWLCGGIAGPGPADKLASDCSVENIDINADYSGGMFGWYYGAGTIENATIKNVTFTDGSTNNGVVGGYGHNTDATVTNLTFENVQNSDGKPLLDHVASIGDNHYFTLADAVNAADNNATISLIWKEGKAPIAMNASLYGKNVTITGTATVDWSKGFLFVGRGGEGNATLTFDGAKLTSASNNASTGIHVSGREKGTNNKYDGTVVIKNSTIDLDYLINKGEMTLDKATLTVKNGFAIGGRPASETESGADATATITLNNGSKVVVNYHNGMGLGYEAIGVMNINEGSTFECTQDFLVTAKGTMNVNGGIVTTKVKITNNGVINVSGESTLNIASFEGEDINFLDGAIINNSTIGGDVFVAGNVTFRGDNTFNMLYDYGTLTDYYGTTAPMKWTVEEGASLTLTNKARYGLGYGDNVTIIGSIANALEARENLTENERSLFMHGLVAQESKGWNCNSALTVENAYVVIGNNNSFGNKPGNYGGTYTFNIKNSVVDASRITFYEALSTSTFTFEGSDVKMGTFMTNDADSKFTLKDSKVLSTTTTNGTDEGNYNAGQLILENSSLTYSATLTNKGTIKLDATSKLTAPAISGAGKITIDAANFVIGDGDVQVVYATINVDENNINVVNNNYVTAVITETGIVIKENNLEGEGKETNPYIVSSLTELELFRNKVNAGDNYAGKYVKLSADVNLSATRSANNWEPIGTTANPFKGIFDGDNKVISNLVVEGENYVGLFGYADNATIKNVTINNANVKGVECVGVIAGNVYSTSLIDNCHVKGNIKVEGQTSVGGIVGKYYTKVSNCSVIGDGVATSYVKGTYVKSDFEGDNIGGIMGHGGENNRFTGNTVKNITISGTRKVGGVVGVTDKATQVVNCVVENVNIETTATAEYAASNKAKSGHGAIVGSYTTGGTAGLVADCVVKNVNFINEDNVTVSAGPITGGARGGSDSMLAPEGVTSSNNDIYMSTIIGSNNEYLMNVVAKIGDVKYYALQDAFNAVQDDQTIVLLANVTFTKATGSINGNYVDGLVYTGDKSFTVDFNEHTITENGEINDYLVYLKNQGTKDNEITFKNGTIAINSESSNTAWAAITVGANLATSKTTLNLNKMNVINGNPNNVNNQVIRTRNNATVNLNEETIVTSNGTSYGVVAESTATLNINEGAKVVQTNSGTTGGNLVYTAVSGNGTINIYEGAEIVSDKYGIHNMTSGNTVINIYGGTINGSAAAVHVATNGGNGESAVANIFGGYIDGILEADQTTARIVVTGGTFTINPSAYVIENFSAIQKGTNLWVVKQTAGELTRTLPQGWSWFSSYVKIAGAQGLTTLESALGTSGVQIKDEAGRKFAQYSTTSGWYGSLTSASSEKMYSINTSAAVDVNLDGDFFGVENYKPILAAGWNYMAYPHNETLDLATALRGFAPVEGDIIKSKSASAIYLDGSWYNAFDLVPGEGYMYRSQAGTKQVSYTTEATRAAVKSFVSETPEYWTVDATQYPGNMTMIATLDVEGGDYEVAAFVNGELRGSARPIFNNVLDQYIVIMTINGDEAANVTFKYYDYNAGEEYDFNNVAVYSDNAVLGSTEEPYALTRGTTSIGEATLSDINIYPNPTTTDREINLQATCDKVEVFNALGVKVVEYQNVDTIDALETAGTYVIRVTLNGDVKHCRLVVK